MAIKNITQILVGNVGFPISQWLIDTDDTLDVVTIPGYLNDVKQAFQYPFSNRDYAVVYTTDSGNVFCNISVSDDYLEYSLVASNGIVVDLPTTPNYIVVFKGEDGTIGQNAVTAINPGNIQAGLSGVSGSLTSYAAYPGGGGLTLQAATNNGNYFLNISNVAFNQETTIRLPDPGVSACNFVLNAGPNNMAEGSFLKYASASGTESAGAVTINSQVGLITTSSLSTAAGSSYTITLTNSKISISSVVLFMVQLSGTNTTQGITISSAQPSAGSVVFKLYNAGTAALNGTLKIGFFVSC